MTKLMIINMNPVFLEGIKSVLKNQSQIDLIAASEQHEMENLVSKYQPSTVLFYIEKVNVYQLEMIRILLEQQPNTHFLIMSEQFSLYTLKELIRLNVKGFIHRECSVEELIQAISYVGKGNTYVPLYISEVLLPEYHATLNKFGTGTFVQLEVRKPLHLLTAKECTTLQLLAEGHSNNSIGENMNISEKTVKNHVSSILEKMEVRDRTQAVIKAIKKGWVHLNS